MAPLTHTHWRIVADTAYPASVWLSAGFVVCALVLRHLWHTRHFAAWPLRATLRLLATLLVFVLCLAPAWVEDEVQTLPQPIAIVVDATGSMQPPRPGAPSRSLRVQNLMAQSSSALAALAAQHPIQWHTLSDANRTDLMAALQAAAAPQGDGVQVPGGIILLSDGADNAALRPEGRPITQGASLPQEALAPLIAQHIPVSTVLIDDPNPLVDLRVVHVTHDAYAFIKNTITIDAEVAADGFTQGAMTVALEQDGNVIAQQHLKLPADAHGLHAHFEVAPQHVGEAAFTVRILPQPQEHTWDNNQTSFVVQVVRDKLRVLHVAGRPSWDQRFLREHLKANPNIDLISFYILRTPHSDATVPEAQLALIPFPVERLFTSELQNFDVVIFQNFDFRPFHMEAYLPNLAQAIEGGLGFMMLGGADSFGQGGYQNSPLQRIFPTLPGSDVLLGGPLSATLTAAAYHHPVTEASHLGTEAALWPASLPGLTDINLLGAPQNGAVVLATAGTQAPHSPKHPLLVAREVGQGRTLAFASDGLWRWRMGGGQSAAHYNAFWRQSLRWLSHDPDTLPLQIVPKQRQNRASEPFEITLIGRTNAEDPIALRSFEVSAEPISGPKKVTSPETARTVILDHDGRATLTMPGLPAGAYRLIARRSRQTAHVQDLTAQALVVIESEGIERQDLHADAHLLSALAQQTGGKVLPLQAGPALFAQAPMLPPSAGRIVHSRTIPLWDNGWVFLLIAGLISWEWFLHRRVGLP